MKVKLKNGRIVTINDVIAKGYEECYNELPASHIEYLLAANGVNADEAKDEVLNKTVNDALKEEIQVAVDLAEPSVQAKATK